MGRGSERVDRAQARREQPDCIDVLPRLEIRDLRKIGAVRHDLQGWATILWAHPTLGTLRVNASRDMLTVQHDGGRWHIRVPWERVEVLDRHFRQEPRIRGWRPWLECFCGKRVMKLFYLDGRLQCRWCTGLPYASTIAPKHVRKEKLQRRLRKTLAQLHAASSTAPARSLSANSSRHSQA